MKSSVRVSILIPTYNNPISLKRAIDSCLSQTYDDYEIIITDDSTNDLSRELMNNYADKRIKYFKNKESLGSPKNWNYSITKAKGEYLKFLHHDDWFAKEDSLKLMVDALDVNNSCDFLYCQSVDVDDNGRRYFHCFSNRAKVIKRNIYVLFPDNYIGAPSVTLFRNKYNLFFDENLKWLVDIDFYIRLLEKNSNFVYLKEILVNIGRSETQVTHECVDNSFVQLYENMYVYFKYKDKFKDIIRKSIYLLQIIYKYNKIGLSKIKQIYVKAKEDVERNKGV